LKSIKNFIGIDHDQTSLLSTAQYGAQQLTNAEHSKNREVPLAKNKRNANPILRQKNL
jgi:hypothetical protein